MKKQLQKITLFSAFFLSVGISVLGQVPNCVINASENTICSGETVTLSVIDNSINDTIVFPGNNSIPIIGSSFEYSSSLPPSNWTTTSGGWTTGSLPYIGVNTGSVANSTFWPIGTTYYLRKQIDLTNYDLTSINWKIAVDNGYTLYLNGQQIATAYEGGPAIEWEYSGFLPTNILVQGINTIAIRIGDDGAGAAVFNMLLTGNPIIPTIQWSNGLTIPTITVTPNQTTNYTCTLSNGSNSCQVTTTIIVNNNPSVNLGSDTLNICGLTTTLDATNPVAAYFFWNTGEITPSIIVSSSGEYHVTVTDTAGCSSSDSILVSVINPTIIAGVSAFCLGDSTTLSVQTKGNTCNIYPNNLLDGLTGWWTFCGNANDESGNGHQGINNGATLTNDRFESVNRGYQFDGVNDFIKVNNIYDYSNKTINTWFNAAEIYKTGNSAYQIFDIDAQSLSYGRTSAQIESGILYVTGGGELASYAIPIDSNQWYMLTMTRTPTVIKYYLNGSYLGESPSGISTSTTNDNPNLLIGVDRAETVQFFKGKIDEVGIWNRDLSAQEIAQLFYHGNLNTWWSDGTTNQSSIQAQPSQTTTYSVTASDGVGTCTDSITIQVNNPQINAGSDLSVCEGETATLTATGADTYVWGNGVFNGQPFTPTVDGYYTVTGTDTLGCSNTVSVFLDVLQPTSSNISPVSCDTYTAPDNEVYTNSGQYTAIIPNTTGCDSTITINLTINNSNSGIDSKTACDSYTWIDGNTYTESTNSATFTLQNVSGCDSVVTLNLTINKLQTLNGGEDQSVCKGENVILTASGAETYSWNSGVSDGVEFSPSLGSTTYTVTGTDGNGCTDSDEVIVTSEYCFEIPGALSPNGDNNNETWLITGLSNYSNAQVTVFDRWGQKVYEGSSASTPWDGKYNGKDLPTADYYYVIELGNGDKYNGVVTLKR